MAPGGGGRAAEHVGRRTSSCVFADNIAKASIAAYNAVLASVPEPARSDAFGGGRQTVLAAVVARDERLDALRVVSLGAGTKFMSTVDIEADAEAGARVRDSHAEVLARRGFHRYILLQLLACLRRGTRVVCNTWGIAGLTPAARVDCGVPHGEVKTDPKTGAMSFKTPAGNYVTLYQSSEEDPTTSYIDVSAPTKDAKFGRSVQTKIRFKMD